MRHEILKPFKSKTSPRYIVVITYNDKMVTFVSGNSVRIALSKAEETAEDLDKELELDNEQVT